MTSSINPLALKPTLGRADSVWFQQFGPGAVSRSSQDKMRDVSSVKDFGAKGDGVTDDTAVIQAAMNAVLSINGGALFFPAGTYLISSALTIALWTQWRIFGASRGNTKIVQATDNTPIIKFIKENAWGWAITDLDFEWTNTQPAANTSAVAILADMDTHTGAGIYNALIDRVRWDKGYRGFAVSETGGTNLSWGITLDNIVHGSSMSGAIISISPNPVAGSPNIRMGHIYARADSATETLIRLKACSGFTIENYEVNVNTNGVSIFSAAGGCSGNIESIRSETGTYTVNGRNIIDIQDSQLEIDAITFSTATINSPAGVITLLAISAGNACNVNVGNITITQTGITLTAGSFYVFAGSATRRISLGSIIGLSSMTALTNISATSTADGLIVYDWDMRRLSADNGDASKTLAMGDQTVQMFETTLTADRTVTLPAHVAPSNAYTGAWFRIVRNAATPGAFQLLVKNASGTTIKAIPISTNAFVDVAYRRSNWSLIGYGTM